MYLHTIIKPPVERVLGRYYQTKNGLAVEVCDRCYDVPLLSSLQALLRCADVRDQVSYTRCYIIIHS